MVKIAGEYKDNLKCTLTHSPSGSIIHTDAPLDIGGKAQAFSPTDLVAGALAACVATTLSIYGKSKGWNLSGMRFEISKEMLPAPDRRISHLTLHLWLPIALSHDERQECLQVALGCPVHKSLHPGIEITIYLHWPDSTI